MNAGPESFPNKTMKHKALFSSNGELFNVSLQFEVYIMTTYVLAKWCMLLSAFHSRLASRCMQTSAGQLHNVS